MAAMAVLWLTSRYSYLLFHSLAELFSIAVAAAMFAVAWNSSRFSTNGYLIYVGIAYLSVAGLDLMHTLAFKGLGVFPAHGANLPTQLWIAARGMEALALLIAPTFLVRRVRPWPTLLVYLAVTAALLAMIFPLDAFPTCYIDDGPHPGLTPFKIGAEYVICLVLLASMGSLWAGRRRFSPKVLALIASAIGTTILSELAFTRYVSVYGDFNMVGHLLKAASFLLLYKATVEAALKDPYQVLFRDLKQREQSLQTSEQRYRTLFDNSLDAVILTDPTGKGTVLSANQAACRMFRRTGQEMIGLSRDDMFAPDEPQLATLLRERERTGRYIGELTYKRADGTTFLGEVSTNAFTDSSGSLRSVAIVRDITERRQTEEALRDSEARFRTLADATFEGIAITEHGRIVDANEQLLRIIGGTRPELIGQEVASLIAPEDRDRVMASILGGLESHIEQRMFRRDGTPIIVETHGRTIPYQGRQVRITAISDITERKRAEEELRKSRDELELRVQARTAELSRANAYNRSLLETSLDPLVTIDLAGRISDVNAATERITGYPRERLIGTDFSDYFTEPERARAGYTHVFEEGFARDYRLEIRHRHGHVTPVLYNASVYRDEAGSVLGVFAAARDITEQLRLEEQLRQAHKMEAIGTLAGGIAHDFNNILASILGFTEMAVEDVSDRPDVERNLQNVLKSTMRARELVKQILAFSRKTSYARSPLSLSSLIQETVQLLRASIPTTVDIVLNMTATSDTILTSPVEVQQILMNLCSNASLAMQENGGMLEISLNDIDFQPDSPVFEQDVAPGEYVQLVVRDTGTGMSPDVLKRVFEPFFTTRGVGKGTGMGLAVVYGIVKSLNGAITAESKPGVGSTFRIFLPKAKTEVKEEPVVAARSSGGHERILFVDDEDLLAELNSERLMSLGYEVVTTKSSRDALDIFKAEPERFDLLITDYTMPHLTGIDLAKEILTIREGIPIILCTGHSDFVSPEIARKAGIREFLMKPLSKQELAEAIRRMLDSKTGT
jgi:PAS domain S-box-containing protein